MIIRSGGPGYVVPIPSSGPTVIQRNFPPTAPVANTIPGRPLSVAPNEIPAVPPPGNEIPAPAAPANAPPGALDPVDADQLAAICERARTRGAQVLAELEVDPIGKDPEINAAAKRNLSFLLTAKSLTPEVADAYAKGIEEIKMTADAKVAAGTFTAAQRDKFNANLDELGTNMTLVLRNCTPSDPAAAGTGTPPAPGGGTQPGGAGTPPAAGGNAAPPAGGNPPAPAPMPANPQDPPQIFINIVDPIIIIEDPLIDDGIILAIDPITVVIGTGGEGDLVITEGTADDLGIPVMDSEPIPEAEAGVTGDCGVILNNPKSSRGKINYTLDGKPFSMEAGYTHELPGGRTYLVEFDKGGTFGKARYSLTEGTFDFGIGSQGWDIYSKIYEAVLDNTANSTDFNYVIDNQRVVLPAREQQTLTGKCPIVILFDQGNGGEPARRVLREGVYKVGVDPDARLLDLFREDAPAKVRTDGPKPAPASVPAPVPVPVPTKPQR